MKTSALMAAHFAAFLTKLQAVPAYEQREEPSIKSVADAIDKIATAFEEYKKTNDARIEAVKKGLPTGDFDAKLARMDGAIDSLNEQKSRLEKMETKLARPGALDQKGRMDGETKEAAEYRGAFMSWVRNPSDIRATSELQTKLRELKKANAAALGGEDGWETRAAQTVTSTGSAGGFALPEIIERQIQRLSVDISPIRQIATVRTVGSPDYKELFDVNGAAFEWVGEAGARSQTTTPDLAEVVPTFGTASARPRASEESLDDLFFDVESWLVNSAAEAIAQGEGLAFVSGNGTNRPTGMLAGPTPVLTVDASRAFGTLQCVPSGQAAALPTSADVFLDIVYALRARYRANARWVTSKLVLSALRKYKDTTNQYLWQPNVQAGEPSTFMGFPVVEAEDMPAVGAGTFPLAFGDFREGYLICDRVGMRMTRDDITVPGFVQFYVRKRVGGRLRNTQAIKLLRISAT
jgi:HK97 family phage major capsid protein